MMLSLLDRPKRSYFLYPGITELAVKHMFAPPDAESPMAGAESPLAGGLKFECLADLLETLRGVRAGTESGDFAEHFLPAPVVLVEGSQRPRICSDVVEILFERLYASYECLRDWVGAHYPLKDFIDFVTKDILTYSVEEITAFEQTQAFLKSLKQQIDEAAERGEPPVTVIEMQMTALGVTLNTPERILQFHLLSDLNSRYIAHEVGEPSPVMTLLNEAERFPESIYKIAGEEKGEGEIDCFYVHAKDSLKSMGAVRVAVHNTADRGCQLKYTMPDSPTEGAPKIPFDIKKISDFLEFFLEPVTEGKQSGTKRDVVAEELTLHASKKLKENEHLPVAFRDSELQGLLKVWAKISVFWQSMIKYQQTFHQYDTDLADTAALGGQLQMIGSPFYGQLQEAEEELRATIAYLQQRISAEALAIEALREHPGVQTERISSFLKGIDRSGLSDISETLSLLSEQVFQLDPTWHDTFGNWLERVIIETVPVTTASGGLTVDTALGGAGGPDGKAETPTVERSTPSLRHHIQVRTPSGPVRPSTPAAYRNHLEPRTPKISSNRVTPSGDGTSPLRASRLRRKAKSKSGSGVVSPHEAPGMRARTPISSGQRTPRLSPVTFTAGALLPAREVTSLTVDTGGSSLTPFFGSGAGGLAAPHERSRSVTSSGGSRIVSLETSPASADGTGVSVSTVITTVRDCTAAVPQKPSDTTPEPYK